MGFLRYIRQWGKKVVFLVNKVDILAGQGEQGEVCAFVADAAARMLGVQGSQARTHPRHCTWHSLPRVSRLTGWRPRPCRAAPAGPLVPIWGDRASVRAQVFPISARTALRVKLEASGNTSRGILSLWGAPWLPDTSQCHQTVHLQNWAFVNAPAAGSRSNFSQWDQRWEDRCMHALALTRQAVACSPALLSICAGRAVHSILAGTGWACFAIC